MAKGVYRCTVTSGLAGLYMPNSVDGPYEFATRRGLMQFARDELERLEFPKASIRQARIKNKWRTIERFGGSSVHFTIEHKGEELAFYGLTDAEYLQQAEAED